MYRIDVRVHVGDDNAKFVFWDNTCIELLGITAGELQKNMLEVMFHCIYRAYVLYYA
jgi:hypothetical protein